MSSSSNSSKDYSIIFPAVAITIVIILCGFMMIDTTKKDTYLHDTFEVYDLKSLKCDSCDISLINDDKSMCEYCPNCSESTLKVGSVCRKYNSYCALCDKYINSDKRYCSKCGNELDKQEMNERIKLSYLIDDELYLSLVRYHSSYIK